jgi:hypothetical protein
MSDLDKMLFSLAPVRGFTFADDGVWIEALGVKDYHTAQYGVIPVDRSKLEALADSVKQNVRGIELTTDYEHGRDTSKGKKASGSIRDAKVENDKLLLNVAFTPTAKKEIQDGEWKYFSSDWMDEYEHDDGVVHTNVLLGGGLTNRPAAKGLNPLPVNFSELYDEVEIEIEVDDEELELEAIALSEGYEFATLTSKARKSLPSSKFLYVEADGTKHLPVNDTAHIRAAISRLSQKGTGTVGGKSWLSDSLRSSLLAKARAMLSRQKGGQMNEYLKRLAESLGIQFAEGDDETELSEKCFTELTKNMDELQPLRQLKQDVKGNVVFAEQFPEEFARMRALEDKERTRDSKEFAENIGRMRFSDWTTKEVDGKEETVTIETSKGLSGKCLSEVQELHIKLNEGRATPTDFETTMKSIFESGIVDYGEVGTTGGATQLTDPAPNGGVPTGGIQQVRQQFAELVSAIQKEDDGHDFREATTMAAKRNPQLFEAYMEVRS